MKGELVRGAGQESVRTYRLGESEEVEHDDIVRKSGLWGIVQGANVDTDVEGDVYAVLFEASVRLPCAAATEFAEGAPVYINTSTNLCVTSGTDDKYLGVAELAVGNTGTKVVVDLNRVPFKTWEEAGT